MDHPYDLFDQLPFRRCADQIEQSFDFLLGQSRLMLVQFPILEALKAAERIQTGKPVFAWRDPEQALHGACERLKMQVYTPRALRRTFIIHALEHGLDARVVARWQGHRDAKLILDTYGNYVSREHEQAQVAKLKAAP